MTETNSEHIDQLLAKAMASGSMDDLSLLWKAALQLPQWHFITKETTDLQERKPFVGVIDEQPWVFVFTDMQKAREYGVQDTGFADSEGNVVVIAMETDKAVDYILQLHSIGVYGMRINDGNGWFSPISNLQPIIEHVKNY